MTDTRNEATLEIPAVEAEVAEQPRSEPEKAEGLSNRDALQQAITEKRTPQKEAPERPESAEPTRNEVKQAVAADPEPPSEFSAAGKKAWADKDVAGIQKEFRRIHDARTQEVTRAQRAEREAHEKVKPWVSLGEKAAPYIAARGKEGVSPDQAIMEALALIDSFKSENPATVKAELKKLGIDLDKEGSTPSKGDDESIRALQDSVNALLQDKKQQEFEKIAGTFSNSISTLAALKTRTGEPAFPGFQDSSEAGIEFARELGSLTKEPLFQKLVLRRFPDADHTVLVREAYIHLGGKVSGDPVKVSPQETQKHIEKSRRAAASTPGRVVTRNESSNLTGKLSNRAALARALAESREH